MPDVCCRDVPLRAGANPPLNGNTLLKKCGTCHIYHNLRAVKLILWL